MTAIVWFRRDLRLHDNPSLAIARSGHEHVVPVFCLDERLLHGRNRSLPRTRFMLGCLSSLAEDLAAAGSGLVTLPDPDAIPRLARACDAEVVFAAADVSPFARMRDRAVADALAKDGRRLELLPGTFVVDEPSAVRTGGGTPYTVFTPFYRRWLNAPRREIFSTPGRLPPLPEDVKAAGVPGLETLRLPALPDISGDAAESEVWEPGERAARQAANRFLHDQAGRYEEAHDTLAEPGTSRLSPYLHLGCISPRELETQLGEGPGPQAFRRQLCWRDFNGHVLLMHPQNAHAEHQERYRRRIKWHRSEGLFEAWRDGETGYPLVDAAMRQLARTGWMHNRARMVVGSFLVKDLGIDWRWGERWFMRMLLDGDQANNNGNWQWIASVGVDPQPVSRRIYNPTLQQGRFDPTGGYVRRYVPELTHVPDQHLAEPWKMPEELQQKIGCVIGVDYPTPIVDHAAARREALRRYSDAAAG